MVEHPGRSDDVERPAFQFQVREVGAPERPQVPEPALGSRDVAGVAVHTQVVRPVHLPDHLARPATQVKDAGAAVGPDVVADERRVTAPPSKQDLEAPVDPRPGQGRVRARALLGNSAQAVATA